MKISRRDEPALPVCPYGVLTFPYSVIVHVCQARRKIANGNNYRRGFWRRCFLGLSKTKHNGGSVSGGASHCFISRHKECTNNSIEAIVSGRTKVGVILLDRDRTRIACASYKGNKRCTRSTTTVSLARNIDDICRSTIETDGKPVYFARDTQEK